MNIAASSTASAVGAPTFRMFVFLGLVNLLSAAIATSSPDPLDSTASACQPNATRERLWPELDPNCGQAPKRRLSASVNASEGEFPSFVALKMNVWGQEWGPGIACGGVLITNQLVLTAAHCIEKKWDIHAEPTIWSPLYWWQHNIKGIQVSRRCVSTRYQLNPIIYDIAVLRLERPLELSRLVQTACLPEREHGLREQLWAVGHGRINDKRGPIGGRLQKMPVKEKQCRPADLHQTHICFRPSDPKFIGSACSGE